MAVVLGTNAGFVTVAPTDDPSATIDLCDNRRQASKIVVPAGAVAITEIGWWCDNATEESNWEGGLYAHDSGSNLPGAVIGAISATNAKGTGAGWKKTTVNIALPAAGTTVWVAMQLNDTATATNMNYSGVASSRWAYKVEPATNLPDPWTGTGALDDLLLAIYAVYTTASGNPAYAYAQQ